VATDPESGCGQFLVDPWRAVWISAVITAFSAARFPGASCRCRQA
jgi:hypothetical protein